ncbi:serpin B4-like [Sitophilus oryzae]|uniref:Serpin B4-like n=1 Tax=Sitophilus oryzae TaxID=7048 RepID=A0A6J2YYL3_SITOR|nr:serpin B4-like [Sitophilus oryzae]
MKIWPVLLCVAIFVQCGDSGLFKFIKPHWWIGQAKKIIKLPFGEREQVNTTVEEPVTIPPEPTLTTQEILFNLGPSLQSYFQTNDPLIKNNYIVSPISVAIALSNLLLTAEGLQYDVISNILQYRSNGENRNHMDFIWDLYNVINSVKSSFRKNYTFYRKEGLFFSEDQELSDHFLANTVRFFKTDIVPMDFTKQNSFRKIKNWVVKSSRKHIGNISTAAVNSQMESLLVNVVVFQAKFKDSFRKSSIRKDFSVKPFKQIKVVYYEGFVEGAFFVENDRYTLVGVPDRTQKIYLYIILPKGSDWIQYEIATFSNNFNYQELSVIQQSRVRSDVKLKIPDAFTSVVAFDLFKPIMNIKNEHNKDFSLPPSRTLKLSEGFDLSGVMQYMYLNMEHFDDTPEYIPPSRQKREEKEDYKDFTVDRPFVFFLKHEESNAVLFWGSISDPSKISN